MFRSIPRFSSAPRSLLVFPIARRPNFNPLPIRTQPSQAHLYPRASLVSKSLFSAAQLCSTRGAEKKAKLEADRQAALMQKLKVDPENVTSTSSVIPIFDYRPTNQSAPSDGPDILHGLKSDLRTFKETFEMKEVPKEVLYIGLGGLVPYAGISLSTLYLAWDINYSAGNGTGFLVSSNTAEHLLHILEPLQIGLGATILSFLGAVHWGLEMAEYGGRHPYKRYSLSILAPMLAWPTLMLPIHYALLAQFIGFTGMYFADSTATTNGWAPRWYMTYRFVLTFVVGASIMMTLIARGQIGDRVFGVKAPTNYIQDLRYSQQEKLQKEEEQGRRNVRKQDTKPKKVEKETTAAAENKNEEGDEDDEDERKDKKDTGKGDDKEWRMNKAMGGAKDDSKPGMQDGNSGKQSSKPENLAGTGEPPEPTAEKKTTKNPKPEAKENNPGATKMRG